jgi:methylase of polypeptide subunit release factors
LAAVTVLLLDVVPALRDALRTAGYTYDRVAEVLGATAMAALGRNETTPGLGATTGGSAVETLTRLWLLQAPVAETDAERALPALLEPLCTAGILARSAGEVVARADLRPYADDSRQWWVVSDLTPGLDGGSARVGVDHVLGISPAATSLAQLTVRDQVGAALDLGTGCGVQSLHLAAHAGRVVATDVNPRALAFARLTAALNEVDIDVRAGSLFDPVAGERFDLVVTNPPFVIGPGTGDLLTYRDSGLPGDRVVEDIVRGVPAHLTEGGTCQVLANWVVPREGAWQDRLAGWVEGCDAWIVQREVLDPAAYVELWLKDAGLHGAADYRRRYDAWLDWLGAHDVAGVGFGWITLRRTGGTADVRIEEWPWEVAQPLGDEVAAHLTRVDRLRATDDEALLRARLVVRPDVLQETQGPPGAADPATVVLRQQAGMRRARQVSTGEAAFVGACDGDLTVRALLAAVADLTDQTVAPAAVRELVADGWLRFGT